MCVCMHLFACMCVCVNVPVVFFLSLSAPFEMYIHFCDFFSVVTQVPIYCCCLYVTQVLTPQKVFFISIQKAVRN